VDFTAHRIATALAARAREGVLIHPVVVSAIRKVKKLLLRVLRRRLPLGEKMKLTGSKAPKEWKVVEPLVSYMEGHTSCWDHFKLDVLVGNMDKEVDKCYDCGKPFCVGVHETVYQYIMEEQIMGSICQKCYKKRKRVIYARKEEKKQYNSNSSKKIKS
jgi:hypothetical protein